MSAEKKKQMGVLGLIVCLMITLIGSLLFVGAVSGWFDEPKVNIDAEYRTDTPELKDISREEYQSLIDEKKSFVVFIDQGGCTTADRMRGFVGDWTKEAGIRVYKMMFGDMKESGLHEYVKYYPSVALISRGHVAGALRADADEDSGAYNNYDIFKEWMEKYLRD